MLPESVRYYTYSDTGKIHVMSAVAYEAFLTIELFKDGIWQYLKKFVQQLHCENLNVEAF